MTILRRTPEIRIVLVWRWLGWIVMVEHADLVRDLFTSVRERDDKSFLGMRRPQSSDMQVSFDAWPMGGADGVHETGGMPSI